MNVAQIALIDAADQALSKLAEQSGRTRDDLLREAVEQFLVRYRSPGRLQFLRQGCGLWKDRTDLPPLESLRAEMDRG
jgi:Ribbon-helix-helix protein, copG family